MADQKQLLRTGIVMNIVVDSILNRKAFPDDKAKKMYLNLMASAQKNFPTIKLLSYVVLDESANILIYGYDDNIIDTFMIALNGTYSEYYNERFAYNGHIFKMPNLKRRIKANDIISSIVHIHKLPEYNKLADSYKSYKYSSCVPIFKNNGMINKQFLLTLLDLKKLDGKTYTFWHRMGMSTSALSSNNCKEKYGKAMETSTLRYKGLRKQTNEDVIKQIAMDVSERSNIPYKKLSTRLGIKNRRDILIEIIASLVFDRGYTFLDAINLLQAGEYGVYALLMEVIISINERSHFGYDYIINKVKVEDNNYAILEEIIKRLNRVHGMNFVEIAKRFSIQNGIIDLRMRTGL